MPIDYRKYVDITSAVGGASLVPAAELITRCMTSNVLVPTGGAPLEFTSASQVGSYFGTSSVEYLRALFYFSFVSKSFGVPNKISYASWNSANTFPLIYGASLTALGTTLTTLKTITTGDFWLTIGAVTHQVTGLDFSGAADLPAIAALIQAGIRTAGSGSGTQWTAATVTFASTPLAGGSFNFVGGDNTVAATISTGPSTTDFDISAAIGWLSTALVYPSAPIFSAGAQLETITQALNNTVTKSNNFGSFLFIPTFDQAQVVEAATWNAGQNNLFIYLIPTSVANASAYATALANIGGGGLTLLSPVSTEYPEMIPGMVLAATNYSLPNSVQNYMYQQNFALTPSVTDLSDAQAYDALGVNYFGQTQTTGVLQSFYQDGVMTGASSSTNPTDMNTYGNEIWLKNTLTAALLNMLLSAAQVSANAQGIAQAIITIQSVVTQATINGVISVEGFLSAIQKAAITTITQDPNAWQQVQSIGYWLDADIVPYQDGPYTKYRLVYTLVYKKNDAIRQIVGLDILILIGANMNNISGYGSRIQILSTFTFPGGFTLSQFADDADPIDLPAMQISNVTMGLNGDLIVATAAVPINVSVSVIANSIDDQNLQILFNANRPGRGKLSVQDTIIMNITYPEGNTVTLSNGVIVSGMPGESVASAGRMKSKTYSFAFENLIGA